MVVWFGFPEYRMWGLEENGLLGRVKGIISRSEAEISTNLVVEQLWFESSFAWVFSFSRTVLE